MQKKNLITTLIIFTVIFACHLIIFLAFYPGLCTYDLNTQIAQYVDQAFITNHPLIHTLFVGFFHDLFAGESQNYNLGYAFATVIQLILVDASMTYSVSYLKKKSTNRFTYLIAILFYAIFPVNSLLAISHTKDVLFAAFALIFFIDSLHFIENDTKSFNALFFARMTVNATLMLLNRNNAVYAMLATIIIICILCFVSHKKKIATKSANFAAILILSLILAIISNKTLILATNAHNGSIKEAMSIPAQIMGRIYNTVASEEEKEIISEYIPNAEEYKYYISDPMKKDLPFEIWESKCKHFLLDSAIIATKHPVTSIQAVWFNIQGYFDPLHQPYSSDHFFLARHDYRGDAVQDSKIPVICNLYVDLFRNTSPSNPFTVILNMAIYVWSLIISFIILIRRQNKVYYAYIYALFYLLTLLLGPSAIIRYGFIFVIISPITLFYVFSSKKH